MELAEDNVSLGLDKIVVLMRSAIGDVHVTRDYTIRCKPDARLDARLDVVSMQPI